MWLKSLQRLLNGCYYKSKFIVDIAIRVTSSTHTYIVCFLDLIISLRERLRTHKVFTKDQCFFILITLNLHKIICCGCVLESPKSYVVDVY